MTVRLAGLQAAAAELARRVLAAGGKLGGFSAYGGTTTKQKLLALEGVKANELIDLSWSDYFATETDAARAYDIKARQVYGEFACTNADIYGEFA